MHVRRESEIHEGITTLHSVYAALKERGRHAEALNISQSRVALEWVCGIESPAVEHFAKLLRDAHLALQIGQAAECERQAS